MRHPLQKFALLAAVLCASQAKALNCNGVQPTIYGTSGHDLIVGTMAPDVIHGMAGDDNIKGAQSNDVICGGKGNDIILGGQGRDQNFGEAGNDIVRGGTGDDIVNGGIGNDAVAGDRGSDVAYGGKGYDAATGGAFIILPTPRSGRAVYYEVVEYILFPSGNTPATLTVDYCDVGPQEEYSPIYRDRLNFCREYSDYYADIPGE